jgi:hypothetical protein
MRRILIGVLVAIASIASLPIGRMLADREETRSIHVKLAGGADESAIAGHADGRIGPLFLRPADALSPDLVAWRRIEVHGSRRGADRIVRELLADPRIRTAFIAPDAQPASIRGGIEDDGCPVKTPLYQPYQGYLSEAPRGINAPIAWSRPNGRGEGVSFADIEGAWNFAHEDLPGDCMAHVGGPPIPSRDWESHGTAVAGVVAARDNGIGMLGIAPGIDRILVASVGVIGPAAAIDLAQSKLPKGGVLLIELHAIGPRDRWLPMEYWDDVYDAVKNATARGIVVVEAAGNGAENLDHPAYARKLDRRHRDSGAIMVGAGAPPEPGFVDRSRLDFSNYGTRVDVQGWGRKVATLDYGDLQGCAQKDRKYTRTFSGTSSASPIVTGAAILLQSIFSAAKGTTLSSIEIRDILSATGSPQTDGPSGPKSQHIGPRPDLAKALERIDRM